MMFDGGEVMDWLFGPLSGAAEHHLPIWVAWHGRGMVMAWGILVPLGILVARYWKVTPAQRWPAQLDNKFWWTWHQRLQYSALAVALIAIVPVVASVSQGSMIGWVHGIVGWAVMAFGLIQAMSGLLRGSKGGPTAERGAHGDWRGDHYDMTPRRLVFEYVHKFGGLAALLIGMAAIVTGLVAADAPRWMLLVIIGWWSLLALLAARWQRAGRALDTYQAIWGLDPAHPGNRRRPIGIGVRQEAKTAE